MNQLIDFLRRYTAITSLAGQDLLKVSTLVHRHKGDSLIRQGQIATNMYFIIQGMLKASIRKQSGGSVTSWFAYEGMVAGSLAALYAGKPSSETIVCLEDCTLYSLSGNDIQLLSQQHPCLNTLFRKIAEEYCCLLDDRCITLQTLSAQERYEKLLSQYPQVLLRAPLGDVASFLGMKQETLSRIRKNI